MEKFLFTFVDDVRELSCMLRQSVLTMEEGLEISKAIWAEGGHDVYAELVVKSEFSISELCLASIASFEAFKFSSR